MLGGRKFHSLIVVGKKLFPNMFAEYLICKNLLSCLREDQTSVVLDSYLVGYL